MSACPRHREGLGRATVLPAQDVHPQPAGSPRLAVRPSGRPRRGKHPSHASRDACPSEVEAAALWIRQRFDAPFALANKRLVTDGAYAYVRENPSELYRVKTSQHAFVEVLEDHLKPLIFEADDYPVAFEVRIPGVAIDPRFNAGRMTFVRNRVPVFAVIGSLTGGDSVDEVMQQYGLTLQEVAAVDEHRAWAATAA